MVASTSGQSNLIGAIGFFFNLDLTYTTGGGNTGLVVTGQGGIALSSGNLALITAPSTTAGKTVLLPIAAGQSLKDSTNTGPEILGRWGTTPSVAWGLDMPIYIGLVNFDNTAANARFFLTRQRAMTTTPASTNNIGIGGTAPSTSAQNNIVLFGTAANTSYNSKPCVILGSLRATIDSSVGGSMAITALTAGQDGFGLFQEGILFTFPISQNGATSGKYMLDNGGTAPTFTAVNTILYYLDSVGQCNVQVLLTNAAAGTAGAGAVNANLYMPFSMLGADGVYGYPLGAAFSSTAGGVTIGNFFSDPSATAKSFVNIIEETVITSSTNTLTNAAWAAAARVITGSLTFKISP